MNDRELLCAAAWEAIQATSLIAQICLDIQKLPHPDVATDKGVQSGLRMINGMLAQLYSILDSFDADEDDEDWPSNSVYESVARRVDEMSEQEE